MKLKPLNLPAQFLIMVMVALVLGLMIQFAQAQTVSTIRTGSNYVTSKMPTKTWGKEILEKTSLSYYQQFSGPTLSGEGGQTYNVFQESRSPMQSFHSLMLRYDFTADWAIGATLAATSAYGNTQSNIQSGVRQREIRDEFYNARFFITPPSFKTRFANFATTFAYEAPSSVFARQNNMDYGLVLMPSITFNLPNPKFSLSLLGTYWRAKYPNNFLTQPGYVPSPRQNATINAGPYASYSISDKWKVYSSVTFDWDQRGDQLDSRQFNNNLPDRARLGATYFPPIKHFTSVGVFTQGLLDYTTDTQLFGAELALNL